MAAFAQLALAPELGGCLVVSGLLPPLSGLLPGGCFVTRGGLLLLPRDEVVGRGVGLGAREEPGADLLETWEGFLSDGIDGFFS